MKKLADKFDPIDVIAMMIIFGCITSMAIRGDTLFKDVLQTIIGFYFGKNINKDTKPPTPEQKNGLMIIFFLMFNM